MYCWRVVSRIRPRHGVVTEWKNSAFLYVEKRKNEKKGNRESEIEKLYGAKRKRSMRRYRAFVFCDTLSLEAAIYKHHNVVAVFNGVYLLGYTYVESRCLCYAVFRIASFRSGNFVYSSLRRSRTETKWCGRLESLPQNPLSESEL